MNLHMFYRLIIPHINKVSVRLTKRGLCELKLASNLTANESYDYTKTAINKALSLNQQGKKIEVKVSLLIFYFSYLYFIFIV